MPHQTSCVDHKDRNDMWPTAAFAYSFTMPTVLQSIQKNFTQSMSLKHQTFCGRTDVQTEGRTDVQTEGRTDGHFPPLMLLGWLNF